LYTVKKTILIFLLILFQSAIILAQWSSDPYENTIVSYQAYDPQMISDGDGGAIIVYWSSAYYGLRAQRLDKYGHICWGDSGVSVGDVGYYHDEDFSLCSDAEGGAIITYYDIYTYPPYEYCKLYVQRIDSSGNRLWGDRGTNVFSIDSLIVRQPRIVADDAGGAYVVWVDDRESLAYWQLYGQKLDNQSNEIWEHNGINISGETGDNYLKPGIVSGAPGCALVFWHELDYLWGQRVDSNANFYWGNEGIILPENLSYWNSFTSDDEGGCVLTSRYPEYGGPFVFYSQRIGNNGAFLWGDSGIALSETSTTNSFYMRLVKNAGGIYTAWSDDHTGTGIAQAYFERVDVNGGIVIEPSSLTSSDSASSSPRVTSSGQSDIIILYLDQRCTTFRVQKLDTLGNKYWQNDNVIITYNINNYPTNHLIINDLSGGAISCWTVYPAILYAQQISANGNLGEVLSVKHENQDPLPSQITLYPCYPNPLNNQAIISYYLPVKSYVNLTIYDLAGRYVAGLTEGYRNTGYHELIWDAEGLASGLYFIRLQAGDYRQTQKIILLK